MSILFFSAFYFFLSRPKKIDSHIDNIKIKASAPKRSEKILLENNTQELKSPLAIADEGEVVEESVPVEEEGDIIGESSSDEETDQSEDMADNDLEKNWQDHLRNSLSTLEPEYGQEIFDAYVKEKENFQRELDAMIRDNQRSQELEAFVEDLEIRHEEKIREIFGSHYDEVKEQQGRFMERMPALSPVQNQ